MEYQNLQIIHKHGQPYGIRDAGGFLLFFPTVNKYSGQEQRYIEEIQECYDLAEIILNALKQHWMPLPEPPKEETK